MKQRSVFAGVAVLLGLGAGVRASDPVGVYAVIDKVVLEPTDAAPERVQLWGTFALSGPGRAGPPTPYPAAQGGYYLEPQRGYLYYALPEGETLAKAARTEWSDLKSLAGTPQCVAFGDRWSHKTRVRPGCDPHGLVSPRSPQGDGLFPQGDDADTYTVNLGLTLIRNDTTDPPPMAVLSTPTPISPADGSTAVRAGRVTLTIRNVIHPEHATAKYALALEDRHGRREEATDIQPGDVHTSWSPETELRAGEAYTWRVQAIDGNWTSPVAIACFQLFFLRADANGDAVVDISDAVGLLLHLFSGDPAPKPLAAGDMDGNGALEITDSIYLLTHLFLGGPAPPPPYPAPGLSQ